MDRVVMVVAAMIGALAIMIFHFAIVDHDITGNWTGRIVYIESGAWRALTLKVVSAQAKGEYPKLQGQICYMDTAQCYPLTGQILPFASVINWKEDRTEFRFRCVVTGILGDRLTCNQDSDPVEWILKAWR